MAWAEELLPPEVVFVGGHPMAGSERHGIASAHVELFRNATYCMTPSSAAQPQSMTMLEQLVVAIGARPLIIDAATHDAYVAAVSHLPFVLSAALMHQTASTEMWPQMSQIAATGYRDMTRLASGDPMMHRDICLTNALAIGDELRAMAQRLSDLADKLDDPSHLENLFKDAKQQRDDWLRQRSREQ
jgi:prephenate dehydrogenase